MASAPYRLAAVGGAMLWRGARDGLEWLRPSPAWAYTLRVMLAVAIAMYSAYWLELETPYSAGVTVVIVMSASRGSIISKSVWRVFGTVAGGVAAVVLIALFVQTPVLFVLGLAVWIGFCTGAASLLRFNRGYALVLTGFTVGLVVFGAIADPGRIFDLAAGRVAAVTIGVLSTALVFLATDPGPGRRPLEGRVAGLVSRAAGLLRDTLQSGDILAAVQARSLLATELMALDQVVEFAAAEDAGFALFAGDLRFAVAVLFASLVGGLHTMVLVRRLGVPGSGAALALEEALGRLADAEPGWVVADMRAAVTQARDALAREAEACRTVPTLATLDQAVALLSQFAGALGSLQALQEGVPRVQPIRLRSYVNFVTAWRNGLRATLAVSMAGLFWIVSQWPDGGSMLALLGAVCSLAAQTDSAAQASVDFMKGITLSVLAAFFCTYAIMPQITGFPLLMAAMLPFIAAGVLLSRRPGYGVISLGYLVFFITAVAPGNPMQFNLAGSLNIYFAFLLAGGCAALAFRVLLPPNRLAEARVLAHSLRNSVQRLVRRRYLPQGMVWEHLQHQKMVRLAARLAADPALRARAIENGTAAIVIGRHILKLRHAIADPSLPQGVRDAASRTIASLRRLCAAPAEAAATARAEAARLGTADAPQPVLHIAATLHDLAELVGGHLEFFTRATLLWKAL
jgi:uncharacterized membrane protein YccC